MNSSHEQIFVEKSQMTAKDNIEEVAELFSELSPAAQDKIIDLIKSLLLMK